MDAALRAEHICEIEVLRVNVTLFALFKRILLHVLALFIQTWEKPAHPLNILSGSPSLRCSYSNIDTQIKEHQNNNTCC